MVAIATFNFSYNIFKEPFIICFINSILTDTNYFVSLFFSMLHLEYITIECFNRIQPI